VFSVSDNISEKYFLAFLGAAGFLSASAFLTAGFWSIISWRNFIKKKEIGSDRGLKCIL
jgi:hypothetical protein